MERDSWRGIGELRLEASGKVQRERRKDFKNVGRKGDTQRSLGAGQKESSVLFLCCGRREAIRLGYGPHLLEPVDEGLRNHERDLCNLFQQLYRGSHVEEYTKDSGISRPDLEPGPCCLLAA